MRVFLLIAFFPFVCIFAQNQKSPLVLSDIMKGKDFIGHWPSEGFWAEDSRSFYFSWNPNNTAADSLYQYKLEKGEIRKTTFQEREEITRYATIHKNEQLTTFAKNGDLFIKQKGQPVFQITHTQAAESAPHFSLDTNLVYFTKNKNLFHWNRFNGKTTQLTNFKKGTEKKPPTVSDYQKWLADEELGLIKYLARKKEQQEAREKNSPQKEESTAFYTDFTIRNLQISPNGKTVHFQLLKRQDGEQKTEVPSYVTESGMTEMLPARSNVGGSQPTYKSGIWDITKDTVYFLSTADLPAIYDYPVFSTKPTDEEEERPTYIGKPVWSDDGKKAVFVVQSLDNKDRWICELELETGKLTNLDHQHDDAWIGGPGISQWRGYTSEQIGWLPDNKNIWFQSEKSGWSHLYVLDIETKKQKRLTKGNYEIFDPQISKDERYWYFHSSQEDLGERHFYRMLLYGGKAEKLTTLKGNNQVTLSPDEKSLLIRYSNSNTPWELYLQENRKNAPPKKITKSTSAAFDAYGWRKPELVTFKASDGEEVTARLYRPENPIRYGSAVVFVHGAGYLQNAHQWWSSYYREYLFHNMLVDMGYTVLDIDYRGSSGYGKDWRTDVYRHMGGKDLSDHIDGAQYLIDSHNIDQHKIGMYGGSYGGFITMMAMFNHPDVFACGAALRSVTDWAHYNHSYTCNRLNTPQTDSLAYRQSSPIYFADGLKNPLLILHGMIDTNVHFQDVVRLSQRLIELGKTDWELAVYPLEGHSFVEPESWADEYRRILELFNENLR